MDLRVLDDVLRDDRVVTAISEDFALYLRTLPTDRRGVTIRNLMSHGMVPTEAFQQVWTDRLVHAVLFLLVARVGDPPAADEE